MLIRCYHSFFFHGSTDPVFLSSVVVTDCPPCGVVLLFLGWLVRWPPTQSYGERCARCQRRSALPFARALLSPRPPLQHPKPPRTPLWKNRQAEQRNTPVPLRSTKCCFFVRPPPPPAARFVAGRVSCVGGPASRARGSWPGGMRLLGAFDLSGGQPNDLASPRPRAIACSASFVLAWFGGASFSQALGLSALVFISLRRDSSTQKLLLAN